MEWRIGISSGSVSHLNAKEMIELLERENCKIVDLRIDKMHCWTKEGLYPFIKQEIDIAFIGTSIRLGNKYWTEKRIKRHISGYGDFPLKVFADEDCTNSNIQITKNQINIIRKIQQNKKILCETHHGCCSVRELIKLNELFDIYVVLDIFGLAKISQQPIKDSYILAPITECVQVKGFDWENPHKSTHLPLRKTDYLKTKVIIKILSNFTRKITLETKSNSVVDDLNLLHETIK